MKRLGRGLGSLIQDTEVEKPTNELSLSEIRPNPFQPRRVFDPVGLEELRDSIRNHGLLQPVVVRKAENGYQLISGERRWRASRLAGLPTIAAIVRKEVSDNDMLELALVENVQRRDLNAIERARAFKDMMVQLETTQQDVADKVGLKRSTVANLMRLLELPEGIQEMISDERLSMGHGRALLGLPNAEQAVPLAKAAIEQGFSVRELERRVRDASAAEPTEAAAKPQVVDPVLVPWAKSMEERIRENLGTRIQLKNGPKYRGQIVIHYYNREDLERIYEILAPREEI
jgi:ParB family transcriptional regulator, chromosome partitioning protein